jgi:hypothetical protein
MGKLFDSPLTTPGLFKAMQPQSSGNFFDNPLTTTGMFKALTKDKPPPAAPAINQNDPAVVAARLRTRAAAQQRAGGLSTIASGGFG